MRDGGGCATCPVEHCQTLTYRGSTCMAQRAKLGLGDPWNNGDRIRAMSDEELADGLLAVSFGMRPWCDFHCENQGADGCDNCIKAWLRQPAKEEST